MRDVKENPETTTRPMREADVDAVDRLHRLAFGKWFGVADPTTTFGDAQTVRTRFAAAPEWAFVAEHEGLPVGAVFAARWGSYGFFGPLMAHPDLWNAGIASQLLVPVLALFDAWQLRVGALFTFAQSTKHLHLYQKHGFWPQFLTAVFERMLASPAVGTFALLSGRDDDGRATTLAQMRAVTDALFTGFDLTHEAQAVLAGGVGDVVLVEDDGAIVAFAVCHLGAGETQSTTCLIKVAAVAPGVDAPERFDRLIDACEALASARGLSRMYTGVNTGHHEAYRRLIARGYRTAMTGVLMHRPNDPGFARADVYALGDLR